jgi:large conductance mechanosensitive channel
MLKEFRTFLLRGNVIDLAVAVVIGAAFGAVVTALVEDLMTPLIAAIFGEPDFSGLTFTINESVFYYGDFINAVITFVSVAAAIFFFVVKPINMVTERARRGQGTPDPTASARYRSPPAAACSARNRFRRRPRSNAPATGTTRSGDASTRRPNGFSSRLSQTRWRSSSRPPPLRSVSAPHLPTMPVRTLRPQVAS